MPPPPQKKKSSQFVQLFTASQLFYSDFFLPAPWNALKSKSSA